MEIAVGSTSPAVLHVEIVLLLGGMYIYFRYKASSGNLTFNANEQRALENMNNISVGILFLGAVDLDIICRVYIKTSSGSRSFRFSPNGWGHVYCVIRQKTYLVFMNIFSEVNYPYYFLRKKYGQKTSMGPMDPASGQ